MKGSKGNVRQQSKRRGGTEKRAAKQKGQQSKSGAAKQEMGSKVKKRCRLNPAIGRLTGLRAMTIHQHNLNLPTISDGQSSWMGLCPDGCLHSLECGLQLQLGFSNSFPYLGPFQLNSVDCT